MVTKMAMTIPSTNIQLFGNLNISPNYENSLYFATTVAKDTYFDTLPKKAVFMSCSYQRENRNYIRVQTNISNVYNAQYMRFQNPDFENKWFYAFIFDVNYVNNATTEIGYQIDYLMTWMGGFTLNQCYVARQHVRNDNIGANIADENLPCGEYIDEQTHATIDCTNMAIVILYSDTTAAGELVNGVYQGAKVGVFQQNEVDLLNRLIQSIIDNNQSDNIIGMYMIPKSFSGKISNRAHMETYNFDKPYTDFDGYVPKNNKLFCYPYKYCIVDNMEGQTQLYQYEYFNARPDSKSEGRITFTVSGVISSSPQLLLYPRSYKIIKGDSLPIASLSMSHFPVSSWSVDSYKAWVAQKNAYYPLEQQNTGMVGVVNAGRSAVMGAGAGALAGLGIGTAIAPGVGSAVGAIIGGLVGGFGGGLVNTGFDMLENRVQKDIMNTTNITAPTINKSQQSTDVLYAEGSKTFQIQMKCITKNYAMMIDDYFTMYGYAIREVMTPSMNVREHYTYVRTVGCSVGGDIPAYDAAQIEKIFDNGIRFWKNHTEIGNYDLDNSKVVG